MIMNCDSRIRVTLLVALGASLAGCPLGDARLEQPSDPCFSAAECDDGNPCTSDACDASVMTCVHSNLDGDPAPTQTGGDCLKVICDGKGGQTEVADDADIPANTSDCTERACQSGAPTSANKPSGAPCGQDGALHCDGVGHCVGCESDSQCQASTDFCVVAGCSVEKLCELTPKPSGEALPAAQQTDSDCMKRICDGMGNAVGDPDPADMLDDGNDCTDDTCAGDTPTYTPVAAGSACDGDGLCDGNGMCVGKIGDACSSSAQCTNGLCIDGVCCASSCTGLCMSCNVPGKLGTCTNTPFSVPDTDCSGKNVCTGTGGCKLANGQSCNNGGKCASGTCSGGVCMSKSGQACAQDADCVSAVCSSGICQ